MKKLVFAFMAIFLIAGYAQAQNEEKTVKEEKKIIVKIIEEDGNVITEVIEGDEADIEGENIWISENGDSINIEVEIEEEDGKKIIKKRILIPEFDDIEGLEDLKDLEK